MKFTRTFRGARKDEAFPTEFKAGDECPPELVSAARAAGAIDAAGTKNAGGGGKAKDDSARAGALKA